jgi:hypothetical protein
MKHGEIIEVAKYDMKTGQKTFEGGDVGAWYLATPQKWHHYTVLRFTGRNVFKGRFAEIGTPVTHTW